MASVVPLAKALYLCDDILSDPARTKPHLIGVLNAIRAPGFPYTLAKLCVFARLVNGYGPVRCRVRIVDGGTRETVYESVENVLRFTDRMQTKYFLLRLTEIAVPAAGTFWVELYCNDVFVDDATLRFLSSNEDDHV